MSLLENHFASRSIETIVFLVYEVYRDRSILPTFVLRKILPCTDKIHPASRKRIVNTVSRGSKIHYLELYAILSSTMKCI